MPRLAIMFRNPTIMRRTPAFGVWPHVGEDDHPRLQRKNFIPIRPSFVYLTCITMTIHKKEYTGKMRYISLPPIRI